MARKFLFFAFAYCILLLNGCYYDNQEVLYPNSFCDTVNTTYANTIEPIIQGNCAVPGCHVTGGTGTGDFTQFNTVLEKVNNGSLLTLIKAGTMPPSAPLRSCQIAQIEKWIANGAQNN